MLKLKHTSSLVILSLVVFLGVSIASASTTTKAPAKKPAAVKSIHTQKAAVKKAALSEKSNGFSDVSGRVVKADIDTNTLVLKTHGKDMDFSVPGRISMLDLKPGEQVTAQYVPEGKTMRLWQLKAH